MTLNSCLMARNGVFSNTWSWICRRESLKRLIWSRENITTEMRSAESIVSKGVGVYV